MLFKKRFPPESMSLKKADRKLRFIQDLLYKKTKGVMYVNSFDPPAPPKRVVREDGIIIDSNVKYGEAYPNSFLDVYYKLSDHPRPTYFYFHGGGFFMGHKDSGDPLALQTSEKLGFISEIVNLGYNVVNVDYALTPDYRLPVQLIQVNEAFRFVLANKEKWNIDESRLVMGGGSAGADFSEIYGLMLMDPAYATEFGVECSVSREQIRGLVIDEAALNIMTFKNADMYAMFEAWTGEEDIVNGKFSNLIDVPKHIKDTYFPSFIVASNYEAHFYDHAKELHDVLDRIGVYNEFVYPDKSLGEFKHGYIGDFASNPVSREHFDQELAFLKRCMG